MCQFIDQRHMHYIHTVILVSVPVPCVDWKIAVNSTSIGLYLLFLFLSNETLLSTWETILSRKIPSSPGCVCVCVWIVYNNHFTTFFGPIWLKTFHVVATAATKMAHLTRTTESEMHIVKSRKTYRKEIEILCSNSTEIVKVWDKTACTGSHILRDTWKIWQMTMKIFK